MLKSDFYYHLPERLIAQNPLPVRSASRLLCLDGVTDALEDCTFVDLLGRVNTGDLLVFNDTKVIPARLFGHKLTGAKVEVLVERLLDGNQVVALVRASNAPKQGSSILLEGGYACKVLRREGEFFILSFECEQTPEEILQEIGHIPLPPYITRPDKIDDQQRYQTVYARRAGAVAAPTAGLHFDTDLIAKVTKKGVDMTYVTLHVGSGTFQPVRVENLKDHVIHSEYFEVNEAVVLKVAETKAQGGRVIAVGTTSVRALESASKSGKLKAYKGETNLFIMPGYRFKCIDALVTNFHLPESTLLTLVCAFTGYERSMAAYRHAVDQEYRFFSYGDAMFLSRDAEVRISTKRSIPD